jgi:LacI family transcriptional regulator
MFPAMGNRFLKRPQATIADVATAAGVSKATVSKYLSATDYYVSEEVGGRIKKVIALLDYRPNKLAQGLAGRQSYTLGVIVASVTNPFYPELIAGVEEVTSEAGYTILLCSTDGSAEKEVAVVRSMSQQQVDGIIIASVTMSGQEVNRLAASGVDIVLASRDLPSQEVDTVVVDDRLGGRMMTQHLISHGHQRIAHIAGPDNILQFQLRRKGFEDAMAEAGLSNGVVTVVDNDPAAAASALSWLLRRNPAPTAIFVGSDNLALGVIQECEEQGVRIPDDVAVGGFDNIWVGRIPSISLATIDSDAREIGRRAAQIITERIAARLGPEMPVRPIQRLVLKPTLIHRKSCGCPAPSRESKPSSEPDPSILFFTGLGNRFPKELPATSLTTGLQKQGISAHQLYKSSKGSWVTPIAALAGSVRAPL